MDRPPRPVAEPIVNREMLVGIAVQTVAIAAAVLTAFRLGLGNGSEEHARTMAFATLSISELVRAYTSRSERHSVFSGGVFSNRWMQVAVLGSLVVLLAIIYVPVLDPIFETTTLSLADWTTILPLILVPATAAEVTKVFLRRRGK